MAYIYKITNNINGKIYIGKTCNTIEHRLKEHIRDSRKKQLEIRPLYRAMNKYGAENFSIEEIEECPTEIVSDREQYWIAYYRGYEEGYNATKGGDGKVLYNHADIADAIKKQPDAALDIAAHFGCSVDIVYAVAKEYGLKLQNRGAKNVNAPKAIQQWSKDGEYIQDFESVQKAAEWCAENGACLTLNSGVRSHIANAANGKAKSAYGYYWKYKDI